MAREGIATQQHIPVINDVHDIAARLKEIDPGYFVMRRRKDGRLEVHHSGQRGDTLACSVPYGELDARTLLLVRRSSTARMEAYIAELDRHNEALQNQFAKAARERAAEIRQANRPDSGRTI